MIAMIHLLNTKRIIDGFPSNDENMNMMSFVGIYTLYNLPGGNPEAIQLWLFPLSLMREANLWLGELP